MSINSFFSKTVSTNNGNISNNTSVVNIYLGTQSNPGDIVETKNIEGNLILQVNGSCDSVESSNSDIIVTGSAGNVKASNGDITIGGNTSSVTTSNGDITITGDVQGNVTTNMDDIECGKVNGSVSSTMGNITHKK